MTLADLNSIHFYHPPTEASLPQKRVHKAPNASGLKVVGREKSLKAPGPSNGRSALWGDNPIQFIDMTDSPSREHLSPFREPAPDLKDPKADAGGRGFSRSSTNSHERFLETFNESYNTGISNDHDDLPILEELLLNAGEMRKFEQMGFSSEQKGELLGHAMKEDCGGITSPNSRRGEDKGGMSSTCCRR